MGLIQWISDRPQSITCVVETRTLAQSSTPKRPRCRLLPTAGATTVPGGIRTPDRALMQIGHMHLLWVSTVRCVVFPLPTPCMPLSWHTAFHLDKRCLHTHPLLETSIHRVSFCLIAKTCFSIGSIVGHTYGYDRMGSR
jgi:hypothetical protein